jgi:hypothetical protein
LDTHAILARGGSSREAFNAGSIHNVHGFEIDERLVAVIPVRTSGVQNEPFHPICR